MKCKSRKVKDKTIWHEWFVWHPIKIDNFWLWLQYVERKGDSRVSLGGRRYTYWTYREKAGMR